MKIIFYLFILTVACVGHEDAALKSEGAASEGRQWFKTPDEIKATVTKWFLDSEDAITVQEETTYFSSLGILYGASDETAKTIPLERPGIGYTLALDVLADWLSRKLLTKQLRLHKERTHTDSIFMFKFKEDEHDKDGCFADDSEDWCDYDDQITLGMFTKDKHPVSKAERKKIMHNMQDISVFMGIAVDNRLTTAGYDHVPHYLLDEVFIPALTNITDDTDDTDDCLLPPYSSQGYGDVCAWKKVVYSILASGHFFMNISNNFK